MTCRTLPQRPQARLSAVAPGRVDPEQPQTLRKALELTVTPSRSRAFTCRASSPASTTPAAGSSAAVSRAAACTLVALLQ